MVPYKCSECGRRDVMLHFDGGPKAYCDICFREKCKQEPMEDELAKLKAENAKLRKGLTGIVNVVFESIEDNSLEVSSMFDHVMNIIRELLAESEADDGG